MTDPNPYIHRLDQLPAELVRLDDQDRAALTEAGNLLLELARESDDRATAERTGYLAGRVHAVAGRVPIVVESDS